MKTLLILRHAKSDWGNAKLSDHDRPLNARGLREAPMMGEVIREQGITPDLILSSTAQRARQTANLVGEHCGYEHEILFSRNLYLAEPGDYIQAIQLHASDESILMVVGHNPGIEDLAATLTDESISLTTANLVQVELPIENWHELREHTRGKLIHLWRPKEL